MSMEKPRGSRTAEGPEETVPAPTTPAPESDPSETMDWETRYKYLLADFENFRRRTDRERAGIRAEAEAQLLRRLIPLVEGFQHAEASAKSLPPNDPLRKGLELLGTELRVLHRTMGFAPVARIGERFRPEEHEAVGETTGAANVGDGEIAEIVQQGYRFQSGLLRPAKVLVAREAHREDAPVSPPAGSDAKEASDPPVAEGSN